MGAEWRFTRLRDEARQVIGLEWTVKEGDSLGADPRLRLEVRAGEGFEALVLTMSRPLE